MNRACLLAESFSPREALEFLRLLVSKHCKYALANVDEQSPTSLPLFSGDSSLRASLIDKILTSVETRIKAHNSSSLSHTLETIVFLAEVSVAIIHTLRASLVSRIESVCRHFISMSMKASDKESSNGKPSQLETSHFCFTASHISRLLKVFCILKSHSSKDLFIYLCEESIVRCSELQGHHIADILESLCYCKMWSWELFTTLGEEARRKAHKISASDSGRILLAFQKTPIQWESLASTLSIGPNDQRVST